MYGFYATRMILRKFNLRVWMHNNLEYFQYKRHGDL